MDVKQHVATTEVQIEQVFLEEEKKSQISSYRPKPGGFGGFRENPSGGFRSNNAPSGGFARDNTGGGFRQAPSGGGITRNTGTTGDMPKAWSERQTVGGIKFVNTKKNATEKKPDGVNS